MVVSNEYFPASSDTPMVGAPGNRVLTLRALGQGEITVQTVYAPSYAFTDFNNLDAEWEHYNI